MAAPSGLTRLTTSLCVGPRPAPYRGHSSFIVEHTLLYRPREEQKGAELVVTGHAGTHAGSRS